MNPKIVSPWSSDWVWSLPLIVATVTFHILGLGLLYQRLSFVLASKVNKHHPLIVLMLVVGGTALFATVLHGLEGWMWAAAYVLLGALPDLKSATLYSLGAMTTFGHAEIKLELRWQLMGPLESLDGWILFGLTTAFLLAIIQNVWHASNRSN